MSSLRVCARQLTRSLPSRFATALRSNSTFASPDEASTSAAADPWAHIFDSIDEIDPRLNAPNRPRPAGLRGRQKMAAHEEDAFEEMFSMIFNTVNRQTSAGVRPLGVSLNGAAIGHASSLEGLFDKVRRGQAARRGQFVWTTADAEALDRMREDMELCDTDASLLSWARNAVFTDAVANGTPSKLYPELLSLLMRTFRERFGDPHLALSVFEHARHLSVPSFVFGCTTPAYNELIETRWTCFRDLTGVRDALEEMQVNGVGTDGRTEALVQNIRREVGEQNAWLEDSVNNSSVWTIIKELDDLVVRTPNKYKKNRNIAVPQNMFTRRWTHTEDWKNRVRGSEGPDTLNSEEWSSELLASLPRWQHNATPRQPQRQIL